MEKKYGPQDYIFKLVVASIFVAFPYLLLRFDIQVINMEIYEIAPTTQIKNPTMQKIHAKGKPTFVTMSRGEQEIIHLEE